MLQNISLLFLILFQATSSASFLGDVSQTAVDFAQSHKPPAELLVAKESKESEESGEAQNTPSAFENVLPISETPRQISGAIHDLPLTAHAAVVMDHASDKILFEKNAHKRIAIASTTKLMSTLVAFEARPDFSDIVTISSKAASYGGSSMNLSEGEQIRVKDLFYGALIASANDAAVALAEYVSGNDLNQFVELMNEKASVLSLSDTHFANPTGLDEEGNFSSAYDLVQLTDYVLNFPFLLETMGIREYTAHVLNRPIAHYIKNTDKLLNKRSDILGGKTGFTSDAGLSFIAIANRDGHKIITAVMNTPKRFEETERLVDWVYQNYRW